MQYIDQWKKIEELKVKNTMKTNKGILTTIHWRGNVRRGWFMNEKKVKIKDKKK